jgi:ADP-ribose pyrophosphatase
VYRGYVDDPRNTDNSWMETVAMNAHDEIGDSVGAFKLTAGDDAEKVRWADLDSDMKLYATHTTFLHDVAKKHDAHW